MELKHLMGSMQSLPICEHDYATVLLHDTPIGSPTSARREDYASQKFVQDTPPRVAFFQMPSLAGALNV